VPPGKK
jgi:hypothetical protein